MSSAHPDSRSALARFRVAVAAICLAALAGDARAALLAYDPFLVGDDPAAGEYVAGDEESGIGVLGGQNPLIGPTPFYDGAWIQAGGDSQVVKNLPSLSFPLLQAGIGGIQQETLQFSCCSFGRSARPIAGSLGSGRAPRTIYESFLIDFGTQGGDDPTQFGFRGHELWNGGIGDAFEAVRLFVNHFSGVDVLSLEVTTPSGTTIVPVGGGLDLDDLAAVNGGTHFVVIRYDFHPGAADVVSVYLDPENPIEPGTPDAQIAIGSSDLVITHQGALTQFTFSGSSHTAGAIDEIRWGDTYTDVYPFVPEPGTAMLLALGLFGLARSRRAPSA